MTARNIVVALAAAAILGGCATRTFGPAGLAFDAENPKVYVVGGKQIVVDQEPIYITRKGATITWELPRDQKLTFPRDGIVIKAERGEFDCKLLEGGTRYSCLWANAKPGVFYKYTIKVQLDGKDLPPLDPSILGDF